MSNDIGTHLGYCIYLNKPHFIDLDYSYEADPRDKSVKLLKENDNAKKIYRLFSEFDEEISNSKYKLISYLWGFDEIKYSDELKKLINEINNNFSWIKYYLSQIPPLKSKF